MLSDPCPKELGAANKSYGEAVLRALEANPSPKGLTLKTIEKLTFLSTHKAKAGIYWLETNTRHLRVEYQKAGKGNKSGHNRYHLDHGTRSH